MASSVDKANIPWSVKGVSREAREAVKRAATAEGVTIGEWLSRAIREADEFPAAPESQEETDAIVTAIRQSGDITSSHVGSAKALRSGLAERISEAEDRIIGVVEPLQEIIQQLAKRIEALERGESLPAPGRHQALKNPLPPALRKTNRD